MTNKYFAGIGSRKTPPDILELMTKIAATLSNEGYILRSGGAIGADTAFEKGTKDKTINRNIPRNVEIFKAQDCKPWAIEMVKQYLPNDRKNFDTWQPYVQNLLGRNVMQILGQDGKSPVEFVICWTPSLVYTDSSAGGTGYAIRCALAHNIPIINLYDNNCLKLAKGYLNGENQLCPSNSLPCLPTILY